jgi:hydrogenase maturation protease
MSKSNNITIIGVGNPDCGDDSAGPKAIDLLASSELKELQLIKLSGEPSGLMDELSKLRRVILIDAIAAFSKPGAIHRFDASEDPLPSELFINYSTHSMGLNEAIEMARVFEDLPEQTIVYGIEGTEFQPGEPMSLAVEANLRQLVLTICYEINQWSKHPEVTLNQ